MASTFPQFSKLPPELRNQIWYEALPQLRRPALTPWKLGCWRKGSIKPTEPQFDPTNPDMNLTREFDSNLLPKPQMSVPMALAHRDACGIAVAWAQKHASQQVSCCLDEGQPSFLRTFDPAFDVMHIAPYMWKSCIQEAVDQGFGDDFLEKVHEPRFGLQIALSKNCLLFGADLEDFLGWFVDIDRLYIIEDGLEIDKIPTADDSTPQLFELDDPKPLVVWDDDERRWQFGSLIDNDTEDDEISKWTEFCEGFKGFPDQFEIYTAVAVRC
ncbi:hypothetical protein F4808DRAFT_72188 [Astrocystis sublimbata]|nr:hypothetical protein F4808DRAFT_72188 [Astrocystis sublimbata]